MRSQDSATTRLDDYIVEMLPWAHGHQRKAIRDIVQAIIAQQTGCQAHVQGVVARYVEFLGKVHNINGMRKASRCRHKEHNHRWPHQHVVQKAKNQDCERLFCSQSDVTVAFSVRSRQKSTPFTSTP